MRLPSALLHPIPAQSPIYGLSSTGVPKIPSIKHNLLLEQA
jgi:hypothetical protein